MDVVSTCPIRVGELPWVLSNGAPALTVVCKATFVLQAGEAALAPVQDAVAADDGYWTADPDKGLASYTDLVPFKARADVVVVGHGHAPPQRPGRALVVRVIVGALDKSVEVQPDRFPLPTTVGPIPPGWPSRLHKLHHHARTFLVRDWNARPLPDDIEHAFFNIANLDQQLSEIRPDERVILDHLHPEHPRLVMHLPGIKPVATVTRAGRPPGPLPLVCDTLWIDTDRGLCTVVWRGTLPLAHPGEPGQISVAMEGGSSTWAAASSGQALYWTAGTPPQESPSLPFQRTGAGALFDLSSSVAIAAAPVSQRGAPGFVPPPRPSEPGPPEGMPARAMTMEILPGSVPAPSGPLAPFQSVLAQSGAARAALQQQTVAPAPAVQPPPQAPPPSAPAQVPLPAIAFTPRPPSPAPDQRSIGERIATGQSIADSRSAQDRRGESEPELVGPLARAPVSLPADSGAPPRDPASRRAAPAVSRADLRDAILLLWLDGAAVPRMRKKPAFREILDALEEQEPDLELDASVNGTVADVDDQRAVFELLAKGQAADADGLQKAMIEGLRDDGKFVAPLVLLAGELAFPFDELETLRATVITAAPLVGADEQLRTAVDNARELLKTPELTCAPAVAEGLTQRIRDAFSQSKRMVPAGYLEAQSERALLDQRHYQKRTVFGGLHLRAFLHLSGSSGSPASSGPVPTYLPAHVAARLPLFQRFRTRLIATSHLAEDQNESHPIALRVLGFARIAPAPGTTPAQPQRK